MQWDGKEEEDVDMAHNIINIAPGQSFNLTLTILDQDGRQYSNENSAIAAVDFVGGQEDLHQNSVIIGRDTVAKRGQFLFQDFLIRIKPNSEALVFITF